MSNQNPSQSINIVGGSLSETQLGQAGRDLLQNLSIHQDAKSKQLTREDVINLLADLEVILKTATLPSNEKEKALSYLTVAKTATQEEQPDKRFTADSLKKVSKVLKDTNETIEAGQNVWEKVQPVIDKLLPWLGVTMSFFL
ncbi:MAG: hypothetical protein AAGH46_08620 [Bacteroidota bacterium]